MQHLNFDLLLGEQKNRLQVVDSYSNNLDNVQHCSQVEQNLSKVHKYWLHQLCPEPVESHEVHRLAHFEELLKLRHPFVDRNKLHFGLNCPLNSSRKPHLKKTTHDDQMLKVGTEMNLAALRSSSRWAWGRIRQPPRLPEPPSSRRSGAPELGLKP